jgi:Protein of unknown function (DUF664)
MAPVPDPPERDVLLATLAAQRAHVLSTLDGLSDEALRRAVLPSGWTCLGLVRHLTPRRRGGRSRSSRACRSGTCAARSCTSSRRRPATPATSTSCAS